MQIVLKEHVSVDAVFRCFAESDQASGRGWEHKRISPRYVKRPKGEVLTVKEVRRAYGQRKGKRLQVHFVIMCEGDRYFHLVYDADKLLWILLYEFDDQLLFDEKDVDVQITWDGLTGAKD